jgi:hypothetical protein
LSQRPQILLEPRKSPVQARSTASVDAILEATLQVLLSVGKEQAALTRHLVEVGDAIELVCKEQKGQTLRKMTTALITAFLQAKVRDAKTSVALYSVSSDVDGAKLLQQTQIRSDKAIVPMLASASEPLTTDPQLVASVLQGMMFGVSRRMLESTAPDREIDTLRRELIAAAAAYLDACAAPSQSRSEIPAVLR